jgi:hypothetical protein
MIGRHPGTSAVSVGSIRKEEGERMKDEEKMGAWGEVFGDPVIAAAILDRLLHHSVTVNIRGESYRLKEKLKAGLLKSHPLLNPVCRKKKPPKRLKERRSQRRTTQRSYPNRTKQL